MGKFRLLAVVFSFFFSLSPDAFSEQKLISLDRDLYDEFQKSHPEISFSREINKLVLVSLGEEFLPYISHLAHEKFKRCGGYVLENSMVEAYGLLSSLKPFDDFEIQDLQDKEEVRNFMKQVDPSLLKETIEKLSSFRNRYYQSIYGVASQEWLHEKWKSLAGNRSDVDVSFFKHSDFPQPSVVLTIEGSKFPDEYVILGGHGDSTSGLFPNKRIKAPGADDNASGIATLTEALRIFLESGERPLYTLQFISYAAEEAGLLGSKEIANAYAREGRKVKAVLQFDMTNFSGDKYDFVFISDFTADSLTSYLTSLVEMYLPGLTWAYDECGYACSDHASWYRAGFPVAIPFESKYDNYNQKVHTKYDTLDISNNSTVNAAKFSKLALAFLAEYTL